MEKNDIIILHKS